MYIPYRKAYISGMNPLSFITVFTIGELGAMFALVFAFDGGTHAAVFHSHETRGLLFWLFLGGFVWVVGDLFQQIATKYLGIGRGIPLSNTNQMWGLAWGALVFGELAHADASHRLLVVAGSLVMVAGAVAVSSAVATEKELSSMREAIVSECARYKLDYDRVLRAYSGISSSTRGERRAWWDYVILASAAVVFVWLGINAHMPTLAMNFAWVAILTALLVLAAAGTAVALWRATKFS
jgi:drug/metabolite transporter (DMT)-like permease